MFLQEGSDRACGVAVQAPAVLASGLSRSQTAAVGAVLCGGHRAQLGEQILLAVCGKKDLELPQITQRVGGGDARDAALVPPQRAEEPVELEIIRGQRGNVVAVEQLESPSAI